MPFFVWSVWSFTKTRSPATSETPSIVCSPLSVMLPVVPASTESFKLKPCATESTYVLLAASASALGFATPVIFLPLTATSPVKVLVAALKVPATESELLNVPAPVSASVPPIEALLVTLSPVPAAAAVKAPSVWSVEYRRAAPVAWSVEEALNAPANPSVPATVVLPVAGATVKLLPPTVKFPVVTSKPLVASRLPAKVTWPVPV